MGGIWDALAPGASGTTRLFAKSFGRRSPPFVDPRLIAQADRAR